MSVRKIDFGKSLQELGRVAAQELIRTDYGPGCTFNGIGGHGPSTHGGTHLLHEQINLYRQGEKGSGLQMRFFDK